MGYFKRITIDNRNYVFSYEVRQIFNNYGAGADSSGGGQSQSQITSGTFGFFGYIKIIPDIPVDLQRVWG